MKKHISGLLIIRALIITLLLSACSRHYEISERQLNTEIRKQLPLQSSYPLGALSSARFELKELIASVGREKTDQISLHMNARLQLLIGPYQQECLLRSTIDATPFLDPQSGELFAKTVQLRELELLQTDGTPLSSNALIKPFLPELSQLITSHLEAYPLYQLDSLPAIGLISRDPNLITIKPGVIRVAIF